MTDFTVHKTLPSRNPFSFRHTLCYPLPSKLLRNARFLSKSHRFMTPPTEHAHPSARATPKNPTDFAPESGTVALLVNGNTPICANICRR